MHNKIPTGISLPRELMEKIDVNRGDISRSRYILRILEQGYNEFLQERVQPLSSLYPDTKVFVCPLGCDNNCPKIWVNDHTRHQIVCVCSCHKRIKQKEKMMLAEVGAPETNVTTSMQASSRRQP